MKNTKIVFWDFDNTLARADDIWLSALRRVLKGYRMEIPHKDRLQETLKKAPFPWNLAEIPHEVLFEGQSYWEYLDTIFTRILLEIGVPRKDTASLASRVRDELIDGNDYELVPGIVPVLHLIGERNVRQYIFSNHIPELPRILRKLEILDYFCDCFTSGEIGYEKPNTNFFRIVLEQTKRRYELPIIVGDSLDRDILPGLATGFSCIWFSARQSRQENNILESKSFENLSIAETPEMIQRSIF